MRFSIASFLLMVGLWPAQAPASTYYVDLNTVPQVGQLVGPCYCGQGPLFAFWSLPSDTRPGDYVDFGQVVISSFFEADFCRQHRQFAHVR